MTEFSDKSLADTIKKATGFKPDFLSSDRVINGNTVLQLAGEFWTARQRQTHSLHGISYRACFKAELPRLFIALLSQPGQAVFDPFSGRGTTSLQASLMGRNIIANDINPLSEILLRPRLEPPFLPEIKKRLEEYDWHMGLSSETDLSMFYHKDTLQQILNLRSQLAERKTTGKEDRVDRWIRLIATNRLSGHSPGFFSVYTLPPNQAASQKRQTAINEKRSQKPEPKNIPALILRKSRQLLKQLSEDERKILAQTASGVRFLTEDSTRLNSIDSNSIELTVTSPPFLNIVQYAKDNWLRCWFNHIDAVEVEKKITVTRDLEQWNLFIGRTLQQLFRITKPGGYVAFEVGELRNGELALEEEVATLALEAGFSIEAILLNIQKFTKTANIWGVANNTRGTNSNRIVLMHK